MSDELSNCDERELVPRGELFQLRPSSGGAILVQDFAHDSCGINSAKTGEIHRGLSVPDALQHSSFARAKREDVAGSP